MKRVLNPFVVRRVADCIELLPKLINSPLKMPVVQQVVRRALEELKSDREVASLGCESLSQVDEHGSHLFRGGKYRLDLRDAEYYRKKAEDYRKPVTSVWLSDTDKEALKAGLEDDETGIFEFIERQAADIAEWVKEHRHPREAELFRIHVTFVCFESLIDSGRGVEVSPGVYGLDLRQWETEVAKPLCDDIRIMADEMEFKSPPPLPERIKVDVSKSRVRLDNTWYEVTPDAAVLFDACVNSHPKPVSANHLDGDIRPKRIKQSLPRELKAIFHSARWQGCWLEI